MRIAVRLNKFYSWEPVPAGVAVSQADISSGRVKPALDGSYLMRVPKPADTVTEVMLPEAAVIAKIIHEKCRPEGGRTLSRKQAVAFYLSEHVMPGEAHRTWIKDFEVHDDGPDEALFRKMLAPHTMGAPASEADPNGVPPNIEPSEINAHVEAYMDGSDGKAHEAHLRTHFKVVAAKAVS